MIDVPLETPGYQKSTQEHYLSYLSFAPPEVITYMLHFLKKNSLWSINSLVNGCFGYLCLSINHTWHAWWYINESMRKWKFFFIFPASSSLPKGKKRLFQFVWFMVSHGKPFFQYIFTMCINSSFFTILTYFSPCILQKYK